MGRGSHDRCLNQRLMGQINLLFHTAGEANDQIGVSLLAGYYVM